MWWQYIIGVAVVVLLVYCFLTIAGYRTRLLTSKTERTAEDMYDAYADSDRKQRRFARKRGGQWRDDEGSGMP